MALEIWADSFKEGEWFWDLLGTQFPVSTTGQRFGFQRVGTIEIAGQQHTLTIFGDYSAWLDRPPAVSELLETGKPDVVVYDTVSESVVMAVEETNAVQTGNQNFQRMERVWTCARRHIPFVYIQPRYGQHLDGGLRSPNVWPAYLGLRLSMQHGTPSLTLLFGSREAPEDYSEGTGVADLAAVSAHVLLAHYGRLDAPGFAATLKRIIGNTVSFLLAAANDSVWHLAGDRRLRDDTFAGDLATALARSIETDGAQVDFRIPNVWVEDFEWPATGDLAVEVRGQMSAAVAEHSRDRFVRELQQLVRSGQAWVPLAGATTVRLESAEDVRLWLAEQEAHAREIPTDMDIGPRRALFADLFAPPNAEGRTPVSVSKDLVFLVDQTRALAAAFARVYGHQSRHLSSLDQDLPAIVVICASVESGGRAFHGDPFTGQIAMFSAGMAESALASKTHNLIGYYPHQHVAQLLTRRGTMKRSKGTRVLMQCMDAAICMHGTTAHFSPDSEEVQL